MEEQNEKKININLPQDVAQGVYSNMALISHSQSEFVVDFIRNVPGLNSPTVMSRIIMTPENTLNLLNALQENIRRYEQAHGAIASRKGATMSIPFTGKGDA